MLLCFDSLGSGGGGGGCSGWCVVWCVVVLVAGVWCVIVKSKTWVGIQSFSMTGGY